jgi:D-3-phosphoglycerate dehydrogenase
MIERDLPVVVFTEGSYYPSDFGEIFPKLPGVAELKRTEAVNPEDLIQALREADLTVARRGQFTAQVFNELPSLRGLVKWGAGTESIDIPAATRAGVIVTSSPGNSYAVAESALLLMMAVAKNLLIMTQAAKDGVRPAFDVRGHELYQKTLGIIGFGRIGQHLAYITSRGFDMSVMAFDPYTPDTRFRELGVRRVDLTTLMSESDYISVNCALTPETKHLVSEHEIGLMKPSAFIVNTARGPVIKEEALYQALAAGKIAGAGLDVFEEEPLKPTNPLLGLANVVATPHALPRAWESTARTTSMIQDAVLAILEGRKPDTILNPEVKPRGAMK